MNKKDFASGIIKNNPGLSGLTLEFETGYGQTMPEVPFYLTGTPPGQLTTLGNSEKVLITDLDGDVLTMERAQFPTVAKNIKKGWAFSNGMYTADIDAKADAATLTAHTSNVSNPHNVTKAQVGLANADNTSDANKPISTATQTALNAKEASFSVLPIAKGGTNATTASGAFTNIKQNANTGSTGVIQLTTDLGGTGTSPIVKSRAVRATVYATKGDFPVNAYAGPTSAIQAAIDAVSAAGGGVVHLGPETFVIGNNLLMKSNVTLEGEGVATVLTATITTFTMIRTTQTGIVKDTYKNIGVRNMKIVSPGQHLMCIVNTDGVKIENLDVSFSGGAAIRECLWIQHCQNIIIDGNRVGDVSGNGIQVNGCDYFVISNNFVKYTGLFSTQDDGIDVDIDFLDTGAVQSRYGSVYGNVVDGIPNGCGIRVEDSQEVSVFGNTLRNITGGGVTAAVQVESSAASSITNNLTTKNITVTNNTMFNCRTAAVQLNGISLFKNVVVANNVAELCGQAGGTNVRGGIVISAPEVSVTGNILDNCGDGSAEQGAIVLYKDSKSHISGNVIKNSPLGIRAWNGDGLQSYSNIFVTTNTFENNTNNVILTAFTPNNRVVNNFGLGEDNIDGGTP